MNTYVVDRQGLQHNIQLLKEKAGNTVIYGVIKGDGYGLGLLPMAQELAQAGISRFAVTEPEDVRRLREAGFKSQEILMLRATCLPQELELLLELDATATVGSLESARVMNQVAEAAGKPFYCHVKIDTGMGRYGFLPTELAELRQIYFMRWLQPLGIYTHFRNAFASEEDTRLQFQSFTSVIHDLNSLGVTPGLRHCCNSSAFLKYPEMHLDGVRLGSALLGRLSFPGDMGLTRLGWCRSQIELIREIPANSHVGYGAAWTAKRPTRIAICSVGYYHGFGTERGNDIFRFRDCLRGAARYGKAFLEKKAYYAAIGGQQARVLGHIGMVQTVLDVTDIPCHVGDEIRLEINPLSLKGLPVSFE